MDNTFVGGKWEEGSLLCQAACRMGGRGPRTYNHSGWDGGHSCPPSWEMPGLALALRWGSEAASGLNFDLSCCTTQS